MTETNLLQEGRRNINWEQCAKFTIEKFTPDIIPMGRLSGDENTIVERYLDDLYIINADNGLKRYKSYSIDTQYKGLIKPLTQGNRSKPSVLTGFDIVE